MGRESLSPLCVETLSMDKGGGVMVIRVKDVDKKTRARLNYLFRNDRLNKLITADGYLAFDQEEYQNVEYRKMGRKIKVKQNGQSKID